MFAHLKAYRPVKPLAVNLASSRPALRMTADASIVGVDKIKLCRIDNVRPQGIGGMSAARAVTGFAADVPFGHGLRGDVVIDGMAAVAKLAGRALQVVIGKERSPPVCILWDMIFQPAVVGYVPLRR